MKCSNLVGRVFRTAFFCVLAGLLSSLANANNIRIIGKPELAEQDTTKHTVLIRFDLAWDNSWKTSKPENHDAAWIFVKCWDGESWNHVYLEKDGAVPGSKVAADAVNKGVTYSVTDREGKVKNMDMVLEPGYSYAWKQWRLDPTEDSVKCIVGFFLHRKSIGAGHVVVPGITFKWNYGDQGFVDDDDLVVKVFAIEMVYVPQGPYYLGGKGTAAWQVGSFTTNAATFGTPMVITSEDAIEVANTTAATTLWAANNYMVAGTIPADFPKGYQAFYIMKYEMTQEAYCEFLNTLNQGQQDGRIEGVLANLAVNAWAWGGDLSPYRNHIRIKQAAPVAIFGVNANNNTIFNETDKVKYDDRGDSLVRNIDGQDLAVNFVSFYDLLAYAEFSGLRPMTELEYEKACRGPREPVNNEYAWGSVTKVFYAYTYHNTAGSYYSYRADNDAYGGYIRDVNKGTEAVGDSYNSGVSHGWTGSWSWWNSPGYYYPAPLRVGIFADSTSTRAASGATFWGVMNMSDNVAEMCISTYNTVGRAFVGSHGCGQLDGNGDATNKDWHISTDSKYYMTRGMTFYYWSASPGGNWGNRINTPELWMGGVLTDHDWFWGGMVSSRVRATHGILSTARNYTLSGDCLRGIRLVRTEDAEK
ncbi:MAG: SUMF1/EgtB/PvdO family nonheme iron enzyme [Lentimicrobiaceae bacterium]|nr:SUMF1/EgtB/PvdO family nonheme iron enzyme [Lentimicrobiaceae bacterium]